MILLIRACLPHLLIGGVAVLATSSAAAILVAPGVGDVLRPGTFPGATRYPFEAGWAPGLSMYGDGRG